MKAIKSLTLGLLSAAFLAIGFSKVAVALDPLTTATQTNGTQLQNFNVIPTCSMPCIPPNINVG